MKKLLVIMNAGSRNKRIIEFACFMARLTHCHLTGIFIQESFFDLVDTPQAANASYATGNVENERGKQDFVSRHGDQAIDQAISSFTELCRQEGVSCDIYQDSGKPLDEVIRESRFADLLIIDPEINYGNNAAEVPTRFEKEILAGAECPVIIAPHHFDGIDEVVFCYDATRSSVFAIKLFTYLLPELKDKEVSLLQILPSGKEASGKGQDRMKAWLQSHYPQVRFRCLKGDVKEEIVHYFNMKSRTMVVMGAYGRSMFSDFFRHSTAEELMHMAGLPLFIAHC